MYEKLELITFYLALLKHFGRNNTNKDIITFIKKKTLLISNTYPACRPNRYLLQFSSTFPQIDLTTLVVRGLDNVSMIMYITPQPGGQELLREVSMNRKYNLSF